MTEPTTEAITLDTRCFYPKRNRWSERHPHLLPEDSAIGEIFRQAGVSKLVIHLEDGFRLEYARPTEEAQ